MGVDPLLERVCIGHHAESMEPHMVRKVSVRQPRPAVSEVASVAAVTSVFGEPNIDPNPLDADLLRTNPGQIPIPGPDDLHGAHSLALGIALSIHQVPRDENDYWALSSGIASVLLRLADVHPDAAIRAMACARDACQVTGPGSRQEGPGRNLFVPVNVKVCSVPSFGDLVFRAYGLE